MSKGLLESISLDEKNKTLHIAYMVFFTLFYIGAISFNSPRKKLVELIDYHYYLRQYQDEQFANFDFGL